MSATATRILTLINVSEALSSWYDELYEYIIFSTFPRSTSLIGYLFNNNNFNFPSSLTQQKRYEMVRQIISVLPTYYTIFFRVANGGVLGDGDVQMLNVWKSYFKTDDITTDALKVAIGPILRKSDAYILKADISVQNGHDYYGQIDASLEMRNLYPYPSPGTEWWQSVVESVDIGGNDYDIVNYERITEYVFPGRMLLCPGRNRSIDATQNVITGDSSSLLWKLCISNLIQVGAIFNQFFDINSLTYNNDDDFLISYVSTHMLDGILNSKLWRIR